MERKSQIIFIVFSGGQKKLFLETLLLLFGKGLTRNVATDMNLQEKRQSAACSTWDDLKGSILFERVIKSKPHRQNRATSNTPISAKKQLQLNKTRGKQTKPSLFPTVCNTTSCPDARPHMEVHHSHQIFVLGIYR